MSFPGILLIGLLVSSLAAVAAALPPDEALPGARALPPASAERLPRWRGFNLLEKFQQSRGNHPFLEKDFRLIHELGFNFVRLPMDYRLWIRDGDWERFDEKTLAEIDQAVEWGGKYGIHVCINFHRAPGYTVALPEEKTSLWTDPQAQRVCALHWATFAKRYRGIPNSRLSFNLLNEPSRIDAGTYAKVAGLLVEAIRREDPDRLIIADGLQWGLQFVPELRKLRIAQATRGYAPMDISHYKASWVESADYAVPSWPLPMKLPGTLVSATHGDRASRLTIQGPFSSETLLRLRVHRVSHKARLVVEADGQAVLEKVFEPGPGEGEWQKVVFSEQHRLYQNVYDRDYTARIPSGTRRVVLHNAEGDWLSVRQIGLTPSGAAREDVTSLEDGWGRQAPPLRYAPGRPALPEGGLPARDRQWLADQFAPWKQAAEQGAGVMVGEWGAFNQTPHDVVLRWAEDSLATWKQANMGWAMWSFRGSFGILDSGRRDVQYEDFHGHKLDRKLLELLQRY